MGENGDAVSEHTSPKLKTSDIWARSGGASVITYVVINRETILLTKIYLKSEHATVDVSTLVRRLKDQGLI